MSIPASQLVSDTPGVVSSGGSALALNGLYLTQNTQMPVGQVYGFPSTTAVSNFFGPASAEAAQSLIYFAGFDISTVKPSMMLFAPFNLAARSAWLQSGSLAAMTLTQLQALTGTLTVTLDGVSETSSSINLSAATSFSNAATLIAAGFTTGPLVTFNPVNNTFTLTSHTSGVTSSISYATGTLAASLNLTAATSAILSLGAVLETPTSAISNAAAISQNWGGFVTMWEPVLADKESFAAWTSAQNNRYAYPCWDSDGQAIVQGSTTCFGAIAKLLAYNGVLPISGDAAAAAAQGMTLAELAQNVASFVLGYMASLNFAATNGRTTIAYLTQAGLLPTVTSQTSATTLTANGYSFYGEYANATQTFIMFQNGAMPGKFPWLDTFVNQIQLNAQFQLALLTLMMTVGSIDYDGVYNPIRAAMQTPIAAALNFGSIRTGVTLSASQISQVNQAAGLSVASVISTQGYYLQILDPGAAARIARTTPIINFWYADGGAVQQISLASLAVL